METNSREQESPGLTFILATRNRHKVSEIQAVLGTDCRYRTQADLPGAPAVVEDAPTFAGNARKKALALAGWLRSAGWPGGQGEAWVLADDSGLEVDALGGAPGVHSARFAALDTGRPGNSSDAENNAKLLRLLAGVPAERRTARFRCVIALAPAAATADPQPGAVQLFEGTCEGRILDQPRGAHGFGYDPLFLPDGQVRTFAELTEEAKNRLSHRARALAQVRAWLAARR
jgi:XTP/dITP diphosphohydrolase